jgi:amino acid adenylation domain-containing protein
MLNKGTMTDLFSEQVKIFSENIALDFNNNQLTYKELDERSNQLAHYLRAKGVKQETLVPICINRSIEMIVGILGIIKAGGAYVPIDPQYPAARIAYILNEIKTEFTISNRESYKNLPGKTILLDEEWDLISQESLVAITVVTKDTDLLYVIYTSGSTGNPKGVMVEHQSLSAYIHTQTAYFQINSTDRILQFSNYCFDASVEQIFLALLNGATLILVEGSLLNDMDAFSSFLKNKEVTHLHSTPGFLENLNPDGYPKLKRIIAGGDLCKKALFKKWIGKVDFYNKYGPTECTVTAAEYHCTLDDAERVKVLPIGRPLENVDVYILDEFMNPVPESTGEIYIGGIQVSRGYLNHPELTKKQFIESPFKDGERLYKTGDLGRWLPDGNIEFQGRADDQVKIRGYRIELAEVENTLRESPHVKQCVVITKVDQQNGKSLVAYVIPHGEFNRTAITHYMKKKLPEYMIPQLIVSLDAIPLTPNGKVDKKALPDLDAGTFLSGIYVAPKYPTEQKIAAVWQSLLNVKRVGIKDNFFELGGNSLLAQKLVVLLKELELLLPVTRLYQHPTVEGIAAFIDGRSIKTTVKKQSKAINGNENDIAIVGMAGRFPGADTIYEFWQNLKDGKETTHFFTDEELDPSIPDGLKNSPNYVKARGIINDPAGFDPVFFGINPKLAELMDPQQRIFLEISWEALEHSGHVPQKYDGTIGVFAGCRFNTYYSNNVISNTTLIENAGAFQVSTVTDKDYIASRTAYALDLKGPAVNVQSACSTSLLAIAQAVESIRNGQCDVALAGGSSILVPVNSGHLYEDGAMLSSDGHCRAFDAGAKGTVFSDGAGVIVLKNKTKAEQDGDTIYAVIKGIGLSNDGGGKGSFTAPSAEGQAAAINMAIADAGVSAADISYIEAHGTATPLGDPIEIEGLNMAFAEQEKKQFCAIGSVKSNFGHLTGASGVAGMIKTVFSLYYKQLPPSINYKTPNPHIDFANSPFFVNDVLREWDPGHKRIAGVSSFGVGGTNVHIVLEEAENPVKSDNKNSRPVHLLCWSAKAENSIHGYGLKLADYLIKQEPNLADIAYTLHSSRSDFNHRRFVVASSAADFAEKIANEPLLAANTRILKESPQELVFMFPGQGAQFLNMGKDLYAAESVFRQAMDECAALLIEVMQENILEVIYPEKINDAAENRLKNTRYSQPALFTIGYALGKLWMSWGVFPTAFIGHSIGEFVAAYFSGILSLPDALKLIASRGEMMSGLPEGSMLSIRSDVETVKTLLSDEIALAAVNSPNLSVVAGTTTAIAELGTQLDEKGILSRLLPTSHAFHSHMMDPVIEPFFALVETITLNEPLIPIVSTVTGEWLTNEEATNPAYWAKHLRSTVHFGAAAQILLAEGHNLFMEIGPGNSATTLTRQQAAGKPIAVIASMEQVENGHSSYNSVLKALGQLWLNGIEPNWASFYKNEDRTIINGLPTYFFNKKQYWVNPVFPFQSTNLLLPAEPINVQHDIKSSPIMRNQVLIDKIKELLENASGIDMSNITPEMTFIEMGLDSLLLTQVALNLKKQFALPITFRQLNEEYSTTALLTDYLAAKLPAEAPTNPLSLTTAPPVYLNGSQAGPINPTTLDLISQQLQLLAKQVSVLQGNSMPAVNEQLNYHQVQQPIAKSNANTPLTAEESLEINKPFGAAAKIEKQSAALNEVQQNYLNDLIVRYNDKTKGSKAYTQQHRSYTADPRVVSGFRPATKELVYSIVINKSKGSRLWDIDDNEYIDALNGFGSNMLGYQPDIIKHALIDQIEKGYEIGPQHELSGEVSKLICEFTSFDRAALCNTGSEAVLGAMRIARTVTGRSLIVAFTGSYHGIADEVIVRGSKKLKTFPAAPGIMPEAVQNMLILDYGTDESLQIIEERAREIAAVLVEPIQSRRADFQPIEFLNRLRKITEDAETVLIFDEVISGFRFHPGGVQALFGIKADIGTYGKVAGGGISIGIIAGNKKYMDALDGGVWQYGDDSIPEVGVTYFAGTFVRHPLALATAKASLTYLKEAGPALQENLNANGLYIADAINKICRKLNVPMYIAQYGSLWRIKFIEEYPYNELFFTLMRYKGIHILEGFACFLTTAHTAEDIQTIIKRFEESLMELKAVGLIPEYQHQIAEIDNEMANYSNLNIPPFPGAKLGKDKDGNPAWFIKDEKNPGEFLQVI